MPVVAEAPRTTGSQADSALSSGTSACKQWLNRMIRTKADPARLDLLSAELQHRDIAIWLDQQASRARHQSWEQALRDAIRGAPAVLLVASPSFCTCSAAIASVLFTTRPWAETPAAARFLVRFSKGRESCGLVEHLHDDATCCRIV